jgi:molybdate transport system substrate-binding protein
MKFGRAIAAAIGLLALPLFALQVQAAELKVASSTALKKVLEALAPQFEKATENRLTLSFAPAAVVKTQIDQGAAFDVAVLTVPLAEAEVTAGKIDGATRVVVARAGLGVSMRAGAPKPDVSTPEAFKRMLLEAKSIGYNGQGASLAATEAVFVKLGIADAIKPKVKLLTTTASEAVVSGEAEVGLGPISEILAAPAAELVGPFPADLQWYLVLTAGVSTASQSADAAKALVKFLTSPDALPVLKANGMEPG